MSLPVAEQLAYKLRKNLEIHAGPIHAPLLQGFCGLASYALVKLLRKRNIEASIFFNTKTDHCWVEIAGHAIDITATQFGIPDKVHIVIPGSFFPVSERYSRIGLLHYKGKRVGLDNRKFWSSRTWPGPYCPNKKNLSKII